MRTGPVVGGVSCEGYVVNMRGDTRYACVAWDYSFIRVYLCAPLANNTRCSESRRLAAIAETADKHAETALVDHRHESHY